MHGKGEVVIQDQDKPGTRNVHRNIHAEKYFVCVAHVYILGSSKYSKFVPFCPKKNYQKAGNFTYPPFPGIDSIDMGEILYVCIEIYKHFQKPQRFTHRLKLYLGGSVQPLWRMIESYHPPSSRKNQENHQTL